MPLNLLEALRALAAKCGYRAPDEVLRGKAEKALPWWLRGEQ